MSMQEAIEQQAQQPLAAAKITIPLDQRIAAARKQIQDSILEQVRILRVQTKTFQFDDEFRLEIARELSAAAFDFLPDQGDAKP